MTWLTQITMGSLFDGIGGFPLAAVRRGHAGSIAALLVSPLFHAASSLALVIAFALAFGYLSFTIKKIGRNCYGRKNAQPLC